MRFPWSQILKALFGIAVLIIILERSGGFSTVVSSGTSGFANAFSALTPAPRGQPTVAPIGRVPSGRS